MASVPPMVVKLARKLETSASSALIAANLQKAVARPDWRVLRVGEDPASGGFTWPTEKAFCGGNSQPRRPSAVDNHARFRCWPLIRRLNRIQRWTHSCCSSPSPRPAECELAWRRIDPEKDADGLHSLSTRSLLKGEPGLRSWHPTGVMALARRAGIRFRKAPGLFVGRPAAPGGQADWP